MAEKDLVDVIPRLPYPSVPEFEENFLREGRPVVISGALSRWNALQNWNLPDLDAKVGRFSAPIKRTSRRTGEIDVITMKIGAFLKKMNDPEGRSEFKYYLADFRLLQKNRPTNEIGRVLAQDLGDVEYIPPADYGNTSLFVGADSESCCHYHHKSEAFLAQIAGRKTIFLIHPEHSSRLIRQPGMPFNFSASQFKEPAADFYQQLEGVSGLRVDLNPGDLLYIPLHWWHYVFSYEEHISLTYWFRACWKNWKKSPVLLPSLKEVILSKRLIKLGLRSKVRRLFKQPQ